MAEQFNQFEWWNQNKENIPSSPTQEYRSYNWNKPMSASPTSTDKGIFTNPSGESPSGNTGSDSSGQMGASIIGTVGKVASSAIQGAYQYNANESAREEARNIANQEQQDAQKQQNVSNAMRTRQMEMEEQSLALKKRKSDFDMKINSFLSNVKKNQEDRMSLTTGIDSLFSSMQQNEQIKNMMVEFARGQ